MGYIVRIFLGDGASDYVLTGRNSFSVGSACTDDFVISSAGIAPGHLHFFSENNVWFVQASGAAWHRNSPVSRMALSDGQVFLISKTPPILVMVFSERTDSPLALEIPSTELTIGRRADCGIVLRSKLVSSLHASISRSGNSFILRDHDSANGTFVNGRRVKEAVLGDGDVIAIHSYSIILHSGSLRFLNVGADLTLNPAITERIPRSVPEYPYFRRSPRIRQSIPSGEVTIQGPPTLGPKPSINWLSVLLPPIGMISVIVLVVALTSSDGSGMSPLALAFTVPMSALGIVVAVTNYFSQKKKHRDTQAKRTERFEAYLHGVMNELNARVQQQKNAMLEAHPPTSACADIARQRARRLWERMPSDDDFMSLRVGTGRCAPGFTLSIPRPTLSMEEDELEGRLEAIREQYREIDGAPVCLDFKQHPTCGIVGSRADAISLAQNMMVQAATHHSYEELKLVAVFPKKEVQQWEFIRWLPHVYDKDRSVRFLANDIFSATELFKQFEEVLKQRKREIDDDKNHNDKSSRTPFYYFIIANHSFIDEQTIMKILTCNDSRLGIAVLFLFDRIDLLPKNCSSIISIRNGQGTVTDRQNASVTQSFVLDVVKDEDCEVFARSMAPVRVQDTGTEMKLPAAISFLEGYGVKKPDEIEILANWKASANYKSMAVPIGVKANGDPFLFDIHEKKYGPHGLIAGMTGSGKSEMVQSWILSMALKFSPCDVSFVLIDFKGTGLILPFQNMPHLAGTISDLDTNISRNLIALENELSRRKALLDRYGVSNISSYLNLYKEGKADESLAYLFIIIDEFAEFKDQFPDFMTVVNRVFAIGRTLGVHILLLTQKPAGVVNDKMNANTRFRWCLKVASSADSKEMLRHPDAAHITNPGRAYVQVGEDEVYELIQSYWSGAPYNPKRTDKIAVKPRVCAVSLAGRRLSYESMDKTVNFRAEASEIDAIIEHLDKLVSENGIERARKIWTTKLGKYLPLDALGIHAFDGEKWPRHLESVLEPAVGMVDDPHTQTKYPLKLNFSEEGHLAVYGAPGTGKTTFLQTLVMSLICSYTPEDVSIYIMDFGGWSLGIFRGAPHIGVIANDNEEESITNLARLITKQLAFRKNSFADAGVGNIAAYRSTTGEKLPYIVLVLDNFAPVLSMYTELESFFVTLSREGGNYGIYLAASANATMAIGYRISQNIRMSVALQMTERADYAAIVGKTDGLEPEKVLGRGLVRGNPPHEFQTALPAGGSMESERVAKIKETIAQMNRAWKGKKAIALPVMPNVIPFGSITTQGYAIGLSTEDVEPVGVSFIDSHFLLVSGKHSGGKSNMLKVLVRQFAAQDATQMILLDSSGRGLEGVAELAQSYMTDAKELDAFLEVLVPELQRRKKELAADDDIQFTPMLIVIDDIADCFEAMSDDSVKRLDAIIRLGKGLGVYLLAAGNADEISRMYNRGERLVTGFVGARVAILLGGCAQDHSAFPVALPHGEMSMRLEEHEGYLLCDGRVTRFKAMRA